MQARRQRSRLIHEEISFEVMHQIAFQSNLSCSRWTRLKFSIWVSFDDAHLVGSLLVSSSFQPCCYAESKAGQDVFMSASADTTRIPYFPFITLDRGQNASTIFLASVDQPGSPLSCTQVDKRTSR